MSDEYEPWVVTYRGGEQSLISIFLKDGEITSVNIAWRPDKDATWGIPREADRG